MRSKYALLALLVPVASAVAGVALASGASSPSGFFGSLVTAAAISALAGVSLAVMSFVRREPLWALAVLAACLSLAPGVLVAAAMAEYPQRV